MNLYFVRHGESEANTRHIISNRDRLHGLTPPGRQQVEALAGTLRDVPITAIYSSPILRARQTADILSAFFGVPDQSTEALREYDCGILEDCSDEESWRLHRQFFQDWMMGRNYANKPAGGENFLEIQDRFLPFIESLKERNDQHILLIGHGGLFQLMLPLLLTNIDFEFVRSHGMGHTECVVAELLSGSWLCRHWGNVQF